MNVYGTALWNLLSRRARATYKAETIMSIQNLVNKERLSIQTKLKKPLTGTVLVTDVHASKSDSKPHYTVDCYTTGDDPCGTLHVYANFRDYTAFAEPRAKAKAAARKEAVAKAVAERAATVDSVD